MGKYMNSSTIVHFRNWFLLMTALFVLVKWVRAVTGSDAFNSQLPTSVAEETDVDCVVLRVFYNGELTEQSPFKYMAPCLHKVVKYMDVELANISHLLSPETYFKEVVKLQKVKTIVGYFPRTSTAAIVLKERSFKDAKVVLINYAIESPLHKDHLILAARADAIFSVGQLTYDEYSNTYRGLKIKHKLYLPRPEKIFFDLDIDVSKEPIPRKRILTRTLGTEIDFEFNKILASAIGNVVKLLHSTYENLPSWHVLTNISLNVEDIRVKLKHFSGCPFEVPVIKPVPRSQDELLTEIRQSFLFIIPPDDSYGIQGLESIAAGLPVLAPKRSSAGYLITNLCEECEPVFLYESTSKEDLYEKIIYLLLKPDVAAKLAKMVRKEYKRSREISINQDEFQSLMTKPMVNMIKSENNGIISLEKQIEEQESELKDLKERVKLMNTEIISKEKELEKLRQGQ